MSSDWAVTKPSSSEALPLSTFNDRWPAWPFRDIMVHPPPKRCGVILDDGLSVITSAA